MWHLHGSRGTLQGEGLAGTVDLQHPNQGLHAVRLHNHSRSHELAAVSLLGIHLPGGALTEELHDSWVRGVDLVAAYAATARRSARPEIYWRSLSSPNASGLELIVSVHTGLLNDHPDTTVISRLQAREAWWLPSPERPDLARHSLPPDSKVTVNADEGVGLIVARLPKEVSYVEMVYPSDFCSGAAQWQGDLLQISTPLFPDRLEKGVIRRARMRGWLIPTANDLSVAGQLFRDFAESEAPLTT